MFKWSLRLAALLLVAVGAVLVRSAETAAQNAPAAPASPAPAPYNPGVGDLMNLIVQPHHTKLWLAGHEANWVLAEYEVHELRSALANVGKARPVYRQKSVPEGVEMFVSPAFSAMEAVIRDRDAAKFADAYATINAGCNACHTSLGQSQVVIRTPEQTTYPDQEFRPQK
jgi:hypothetical protein